MQVKEIIILVLSFMMVLSFVQMYIANKRKSKNPSKAAAEKAQRLYNVALWKLAIVMLIKVYLENQLGMPRTMPMLWFVDMIIMNGAAAMLMVKYLRLR